MAMAGGREAEAEGEEEGGEYCWEGYRLGVLFCFLHLRAAGWDHPTLPVLGLLLLFFLALFSPHRNHAVEGRKGTDDSTLKGKRGNPILSARHPGPSKSIASVPVSLLEADFSICSSKFASFNPTPSLVPLPSYESNSLCR